MGENSTPDNSTSPSRWTFITNPTFGGVLGILGAILGIWGIYLAIVANKEPKPAFRVLSDVVLSDRQANSKIKVYYDSIEVQNVRAVTVAIWNDGNTFIDKTAFAKDRPITITSAKPVSILDVKQVATTRLGLSFSTVYNVDSVIGTPTDTTTNTFDYITTTIDGDDGLEAKDGVTFTILYTALTEQNEWFVTARIKGVPGGFVEATEPKSAFDYTELIFQLLSLGLVFSETFYANRRKNGRSPHWIRRMLTVVLIIITLYLGYKLSSSITAPVAPKILVR